MNWPILLTISIISVSLAFLVQRIILKKEESQPVAFAIFEPIISSMFIGVFTIIRGFSFINFFALWPNFLLMIAVYGTASVFYYKAVKLIEASEFTILFTSRTLFTILGAFLILKERLQPIQIVGAALIILSVVVVSSEKKRQRLKFQRGEVFILLAAGLFGLGFVNDAYVLQRFDATLYLFFAVIMPALGVWITNPKVTFMAGTIFNRKTLPKVILLSFLYAVSGITFYLAYQIGRNAAQISAFDQLATILTVVLAIAFLRERDNLARKVIGTAVSFVGVWLLR